MVKFAAAKETPAVYRKTSTGLTAGPAAEKLKRNLGVNGLEERHRQTQMAEMRRQNYVRYLEAQKARSHHQ